MAMTKQVKFEISLKELKVSFEGDIQTAERLQSEIAGALNSIASAQANVLPPATKNVTPVLPAASTGGRRRKRRRQGADASTNGIDAAILDTLDADGGPVNGDGSGQEEESRVVRRAAGGGPKGLIVTLKKEGYFAEKRGLGQIRQALASKGHTFKPSDLSPTVKTLTQEGVLRRERNSKNQWVYFA